jgi:hypothetical protein
MYAGLLKEHNYWKANFLEQGVKIRESGRGGNLGQLLVKGDNEGELI